MGANKFVTFPVVSPGAAGAQAAIDLFAVVPTSGLDDSLTFLCLGKFTGEVSIQGSTDGTDWSTLCQFNGGELGIHGLQSPIVVEGTVVRYLRVFVGKGIITETLVLSVAAEQNCPGGGGTQITIIDQFGVVPVINSDGFALRMDDEKYIDFSKFGPSIETYLSAIGSIAAAPLPGGLSVWASATEGDNTGSGALLGLIEFPVGGTIVSPEVSVTFTGPFTYAGPAAKQIRALGTVDLSPFIIGQNLLVTATIDFVSDPLWTAASKYVDVYAGGTVQAIGTTQPPTTITGTKITEVFDPGPPTDNHVVVDTTGSFINTGGVVSLKLVLGTTNAVPVIIDSITLKFSKFPPTASNFTGADATTIVANPGGKRYVILTSFAGATGAEFPATSVPLSYYGALFTLKG